MFQTNVLRKTKTHFTLNDFFSWKSCRLWDNVEKHSRARQATNGKHMRFICQVIEARPDTHSLILIALPRQQWLPERSSLLLYKYIALLCQFTTGCLNLHKSLTSFIFWSGLNLERCTRASSSYDNRKTCVSFATICEVTIPCFKITPTLICLTSLIGPL